MSHYLNLAASRRTFLASALGAPLQPQRDIALAPVAAVRRALLIGNKDYSVQPLRNPIHDVDDLAHRLTVSFQFQCSVLRNASLSQMRSSLQTLRASVQPNDIVYFYFAGHGVQIQGDSYLLPLNFRAQNVSEAKTSCLPFSELRSVLESSSAGVLLVNIDACRTNPFNRSTQGITYGIVPQDGALGTYVAFAASAGQTASDGEGRNSLFTKHLLRSLRPGVNTPDLFRDVRRGVLADSQGRQLPYLHDHLISDFIFAPIAQQPAPPPPGQQPAAPKPDPLLQGKIQLAAGKCDASTEALLALVKREPANARSQNALGLAYLCQGLTSMASERFSRAIELEPSFTAAYLNRATTFIRAAQYGLALDDLNWALEQTPSDATLLARRGELQLLSRRHQEAETDLNSALKLNPSDGKAYLHRGIVQARLGRDQAALSDFSQSIYINSSDPEAFRHRAQLFRRLGQTENADQDDRIATSLAKP